MPRGFAVGLFVGMVLVAGVPALVSAGHDGPGQSARIGPVPSHDGLPPKAIAQIEAELVRRAAEIPEVQLLFTITGIGLVAAIIIWAFLGDPRRFVGPKQVARHAGLDASTSGEQDHHGRISQKRNWLLRTALVETALGVARHDTGPLGRFYHARVGKLGHQKAIGALARRLLIVAWRMLLRAKAYRVPNPRAQARRRPGRARKTRRQTPVDRPFSARWHL